LISKLTNFTAYDGKNPLAKSKNGLKIGDYSEKVDYFTSMSQNKRRQMHIAMIKSIDNRNNKRK
jgi:hypothetical protein